MDFKQLDPMNILHWPYYANGNPHFVNSKEFNGLVSGTNKNDYTGALANDPTDGYAAMRSIGSSNERDTSFSARFNLLNDKWLSEGQK